MIAVNSLIPIAYGVYLYSANLNPYLGLQMEPKQFYWFMAFNILNCSVQFVYGLILVFCIIITNV